MLQDHANTVTVDVPAPSVACPYEALDTCAADSTTPPPTCCERMHVLSGAITLLDRGLPQWVLYMMAFIAWVLHVL
jgi:hypothetical protein